MIVLVGIVREFGYAARSIFRHTSLAAVALPNLILGIGTNSVILPVICYFSHAPISSCCDPTSDSTGSCRFAAPGIVLLRTTAAGIEKK